MAAVLAPALAIADEASDRQSLEVVRNTVVNLLQALVAKGLLTREQADQMVKQAQDKAATDAATTAEKNAQVAREESNAIRVPYVPQIVKDEISKQVAEEVTPGVVTQVVQQARDEKWGIPAALPDWLSRVRVFGDLTLRGQLDRYADDNAQYALYDYNAINQAGGIGKVSYPYLNTSEDRERLRLRARLGVEADMSQNLRLFIRLSSGALTDPSSESQNLGTYAQRYAVAFDQAFFVWEPVSSSGLPANTLSAGRASNPWFSPTELVFARDLTFEGAADTLRLGWGSGGAERSYVYLTAGGFPMLEVPLANSQNKWLVGGQMGTHLRWSDGADNLQFAVSYYDFRNVTGVRNVPDSTLTNYTAPAFIRYGNSVYDISNSTVDPSVNLFALASEFRLADIAAFYEHSLGRYTIALSGEGVRNIAYDRATVEALTQQPTPTPEDMGYVGEISFGNPAITRFADWRLALGYRYVRRDAVLDAWTDADFHGGGTNAKGYYLWGTFAVNRNAWLRLRYLSGNEIDGPRYGFDILQLDMTARF
jgi:hypothetical protein